MTANVDGGPSARLRADSRWVPSDQDEQHRRKGKPYRDHRPIAGVETEQPSGSDRGRGSFTCHSLCLEGDRGRFEPHLRSPFPVPVCCWEERAFSSRKCGRGPNPPGCGKLGTDEGRLPPPRSKAGVCDFCHMLDRSGALSLRHHRLPRRGGLARGDCQSQRTNTSLPSPLHQAELDRPEPTALFRVGHVSNTRRRTGAMRLSKEVRTTKLGGLSCNAI